MEAAWDACCSCSRKGLISAPVGRAFHHVQGGKEVELSAEVVALLFLIGGIAAAVVFTLVFVVVVDRSVPNTRAENEGEEEKEANGKGA